MLIDCDTCAVRGPACRDCVVTVLLGAPPARHTGDHDHTPGTGIDLDRKEQAALAVLAGSGLVPPLRLVARPVDPDDAGALNWDHEPNDPARVERRRGDGPSQAGRRAAG